MIKYKFDLSVLEYFGHIVSKYGLKADPEKCKAIQEWLQLTKPGELRSFLSIANYYSKFMPSFA